MDSGNTMNDSEKDVLAILAFGARDRASPVYHFATERPYWDQIERSIDRVFRYGGSAEIRVLRPALAYTNVVDMVALPGQFRLVILTKFIDPKTELREWWEQGDSPFRGTARFGDDDWDARTVCADVTVAKKVFKDLFDHGELTESSFIQMRSNLNPKPR